MLPVTKFLVGLNLPIPQLSFEAAEELPLSDSLTMLILLTVLSLVPAILVMVTSFTRIAIVLSFVRSALGTNNLPPNQVVIALALFLTLFTMGPVLGQIVDEAWNPLDAGEITQDEAFDIAGTKLRTFMEPYINEKDLALFLTATDQSFGSYDEVPLTTLIPAFLISELKAAFQMGFLIYVPFLAIDMIVASTLLSMGMFMLPPAMISLPLKVLIFVLADGWHLVVRSLLNIYLG